MARPPVIVPPRFNPASYYIIKGNILNIVWDEVCQPYLDSAVSPVKEQLQDRLGLVRDNAFEDPSGASRFRR
jgi:hypothetical protein